MPQTSWLSPSMLPCSALSFWFASGASLDDQATYVCEAENAFGKIQAEVKLTVTGHGLYSFSLVGCINEHLSCDFAETNWDLGHRPRFCGAISVMPRTPSCPGGNSFSTISYLDFLSYVLQESSPEMGVNP